MALPRILIFAASDRAQSFNRKLAGLIARELSLADVEISWITLSDYSLPIYNGELEAKNGVPENAIKLARLFHSHDAVFIISPEYNGSLPPLLKNTIDWISRVNPDAENIGAPFRGKLAAIACAAEGASGGAGMLGHLRDILVRLGMLVTSEHLAIGNASQAFDDEDRLKDSGLQKKLNEACLSLRQKAQLLPRSLYQI